MSTMEAVMMYVVGPSLAILGTYLAYRQGKRKSNAETKSIELSNKKTEIDIYQDTIDNFSKLLNVRDEAIVGMKLQMDLILEQNSKLLIQNAELLKQNKQLILKVNSLEKDLQEFQKIKN